MAIYRAVLVWSLRIASALILALVAFSAISSGLLYNEMNAFHGPLDVADGPTPGDIALQILPAAGLALLGLALAEILALQLKARKKP